MSINSKPPENFGSVFKSGKLAGKSWTDIVSQWKDVELARDRVDNPLSCGYSINLQNITGLLQLNVLDVYNATYQARVTMFDILYHRFVGTTWCSKEITLANQQSTIAFNQAAYFHTPIVDSNMVFAIEVFVNQTPKDPLPADKSTANPTKRRSLGWTILRPFTVGSQLKNSSDNEVVTKKLDVFRGSPRALLYMEDPLESNAHLKPIPGCQMTLALSRHQELNSALHLLPENSLFSAEHRVPGLSETAVKTTQGKDFYAKPKPLRPQVGYIDKMSVDLGVTVDKFEEELCLKINQDRLKRDNVTDDGKKVMVTERRLMVGVHNGFCYVQKPQYVHLEPEAFVAPGRAQSFGRGKRKDVPTVSTIQSSRLLLRSRLQLDEMIPDPHVSLVMQLEYVLSVPPSDQRLIKGSMSSLRAQPFTVMLRWAAWSPYQRQITSDEVTVKLHGGTKPNPDSLMFFKNSTNSDNEITNGTIKFTYLVTDQPPLPVSVTSFVEEAVSFMSPNAKKPPIGASPKPKPRQKQDESEDSYEIEVRHVDAAGELFPVHAPPIRPIAQSAPSLTRASYARLYAAGFPDIFDRNGEQAVAVDTSDVTYRANLDREVSDPLQANEIVLQFLAFTNPVAATNESPPLPIHSVFFSFQFYRFPSVTTQRLALLRKSASNGQSHDPCVLRKIESGEQLDEGKPGLEVKYHVDPAHLKAGENASFLRYLSTHNLHVDVWDGDSLLLIGSLSVPLKYTLRGGESAVAANHEIDVIFSEHSEATPTLTGDLTTGGSVRSLGMTKHFRGKLHVRFGNVGFPSESKTAAGTLLRKSHLVVADLSGCAFPGGSLSSVQNATTKNGRRTNRVRAKRMAESNQELSDLLLVSATKEKMADSSDKENISTLSPDIRADRKRKIARMVAVRRMEQADEETATKQTSGQRALILAQEENMKKRDLRTVAEYRERLKEDNIMEILMLSITTRHILRPTLGTAEFVEFQLKNPFPKQQTVTIECDSDELRVITDSREWRYFKSLVGIHTPVEENMFNFDANSTLPQVFLRPKETVFIPLCYRGYQADHKVATQNPGQQFKPTATSLQPIKSTSSCGTIRPKVVKAVLRSAEGRPLSILQMSIDPQPHVVDQTFRFYNPERTFLKKCIRLPPYRRDSTSGEDQFHVVCSDPEVVCQARTLGHDEPREIFIKAPCGESPSIRRFYVAVYSDAFLAVPVQIWQFYVHALQRVDVNCVLGQTSRFSLVLRGMQTSRLVRCFPSHPQEMQIYPDEAFLLPPSSVHEINVGVRTTSATSCTRFMYINVVDTEYHQLLRSWLVAVKTREPVITKEFDIELPRSGGKGCNKMITYTNPYPNRSEFFLMTSRGDLLQFRESRLELGPGEQTTIGLRFASGVKHPGKFPIYIFINDREDKNEETFLVNVTYV